MPLEQEGMLGKRLVIFAFFILLLVVLRLIYSNTSKIQDVKPISENKSNILSPSLGIIQSKSKSYKYPNENSEPKLLVERNKVVFENKNKNSTNLELINLDDGKVDLIYSINDEMDYKSFIVHSYHNNKIFFELFDQLNNSSFYYIYDMNDKIIKEIHKVTNIEPIHYTQVAWKNNSLIFNCFESNSRYYYMYEFNFDDNSFACIIPHNCSSPTVIDGNL